MPSRDTPGWFSRIRCVQPASLSSTIFLDGQPRPLDDWLFAKNDACRTKRDHRRLRHGGDGHEGARRALEDRRVGGAVALGRGVRSAGRRAPVRVRQVPGAIASPVPVGSIRAAAGQVGHERGHDERAVKDIGTGTEPEKPCSHVDAERRFHVRLTETQSTAKSQGNAASVHKKPVPSCMHGGVSLH
jgi:hypothetical protein